MNLGHPRVPAMARGPGLQVRGHHCLPFSLTGALEAKENGPRWELHVGTRELSWGAQLGPLQAASWASHRQHKTNIETQDKSASPYTVLEATANTALNFTQKGWLC